MKTAALILLKATVLVAVVYLSLDIFGFLMWVQSGQTPPGDYYIGAITTHVLRMLLL